jgi:hypothetical protein
MEKVFDFVNKAGFKMKTLWQSPGDGKKDLVLHLETEDITQLVSQLREEGFSVDERR